MILAGQLDSNRFTGYMGMVRAQAGALALTRWDGVGIRVDEFSDLPDLDLTDPELQLELELRVAGDDVEFRVWAVGADRPDRPQVVLENDRTYREGMTSVGFRHSPAERGHT